jgi:hypothetical protein
MSDTIINRVSDSLLTTLDLEELGGKNEWQGFDLKEFLFMELILKEKDFREQLKAHDWAQYHNKMVAVFCSVDAIIPMWAYLLVAVYLQPECKGVYSGTIDQARQQHLLKMIHLLDGTSYTEKRVVVKGCGDEPIGEAAYLSIAAHLRPFVKSIMYGEPCSTVPIFKRKT